jgi:Beta-galactosidase
MMTKNNLRATLIVLSLSVLVVVLAVAPQAAGQASSKSFAFQPEKDDFQPNILDTSHWIEAPTGKHGFLTRKGDQFVFDDGTPARFWGAQMNPLPKEEADFTVRRMRRQGINITRVHGLEFLNSRAGKTSFDYNEDGWDRLDYLIAKLGENGIYIILDVDYPTIYRFQAGDNIPQLPAGGPAPHAEFFDEKVAGILHQRMADVFSHRNPYTGKRYGDDPTVALAEVLNEDSMFFGDVDDSFLPELKQKFAAWLRAKYTNDAGLEKAWTVDGRWPLQNTEGIDEGQTVEMIANSKFTEQYLAAHPEQKLRGEDQLRFFEELEEGYWDSSVASLRKAGLKVPISGTNWQAHGFPTRLHMYGQSKLDYVDRHGYWDHPQGDGNLKWNIGTEAFHNRPMVKAVDPSQNELIYLGVENLVTEKAWEQVLGMPMTISEWNTCLPNEYSLEGTGLMSAYGMLQGWRGLLEFGYFSPDFMDHLGNGSFDLFGNPPQILQFPAVAIMWYRQDVKEAEVVAESLYDPSTLREWSGDRKPVPLWSALVGKVGYRFVKDLRRPVVTDLSRYWDAASMTAHSTTGELTWNASVGVVDIDTPRTQAVIGFLNHSPHALKSVNLNIASRFGAVYVTAMDGMASIDDARRILITAVGPARNTGMEYEQTTERSTLGGPSWHLKQEGTGPALLEAITGELRIQVKNPRRFKCWTLDVVGKRREQVPIKVQKGQVVLNLKTSQKSVYYELDEK